MNLIFRMLMVVGFMGCASTSLVACSKEAPKPMISDKGRPETRSIEAANAVGYNGTAMRQKVDKALDANDKVTKQMDQAAEQ